MLGNGDTVGAVGRLLCVGETDVEGAIGASVLTEGLSLGAGEGSSCMLGPREGASNDPELSLGTIEGSSEKRPPSNPPSDGICEGSDDGITASNKVALHTIAPEDSADCDVEN